MAPERSSRLMILIVAVFMVCSSTSANMQLLICMLNVGSSRLFLLSKTPGLRASIWALTGGSFEIGSAMDIFLAKGTTRSTASFGYFDHRYCDHIWRATAITSKFDGDQQFPKFCPVQKPRIACSMDVKPHIATIDGLFFIYLKALVILSSPR